MTVGAKHAAAMAKKQVAALTDKLYSLKQQGPTEVSRAEMARRSSKMRGPDASEMQNQTVTDMTLQGVSINSVPGHTTEDVAKTPQSSKVHEISSVKASISILHQGPSMFTRVKESMPNKDSLWEAAYLGKRDSINTRTKAS